MDRASDIQKADPVEYEILKALRGYKLPNGFEQIKLAKEANIQMCREYGLEAAWQIALNPNNQEQGKMLRFLLQNGLFMDTQRAGIQINNGPKNVVFIVADQHTKDTLEKVIAGERQKLADRSSAETN